MKAESSTFRGRAFVTALDSIMNRDGTYKIKDKSERMRVLKKVLRRIRRES